MSDTLEQAIEPNQLLDGAQPLSLWQLREAERATVQCKVFYRSLKGQGQGMVANLSTKGCLVEGDMLVKEGDKLTLVLHHPTNPHLIVIDKARVVWTKGQQFGLVHETVYPSELGQLKALLTSSPPV